MRTIVYFQAHKLDGTIERENVFAWLPYVEGHIQSDPLLQNYSNYYWFASAGWLWWSIELLWAKGRPRWQWSVMR